MVGGKVQLGFVKVFEYIFKKIMSTSVKDRRKGNDKCLQEPQQDKGHRFSVVEVNYIRQALLAWYDQHKRALPWRLAVANKDDNVRGYAVWVSEVMAQQTQIATVINYYNRWMEKWPTLESLAGSQLEEVNQVWSGLGYYSRAKRLHAGAQMVVNELDGQMPRSSKELEKLLGVGRYTASAIASITFKEVTGVIDGNCIRVLTRLKQVGADFQTRKVTDWLWASVNELVDPERPGDFNQAIMELGALVCTPKSPSCSSCPVRSVCSAHQRVSSNERQSTLKRFSKSKKTDSVKPVPIADIECVPGCDLCLETEFYDTSVGVQNYPRKSKKKAARTEVVSVAVISRSPPKSSKKEYFITRRPDTGMLANMWEFPNVTLADSCSEDEARSLLGNFLSEEFGLTCDDLKSAGEFKGKVLHLFSHIHCTYLVYAYDLGRVTGKGKLLTRPSQKWVSDGELESSALSTAMRKVFKTSAIGPKTQSNESKKRKFLKITDSEAHTNGNKKITSFFKRP